MKKGFKSDRLVQLAVYFFLLLRSEVRMVVIHSEPLLNPFHFPGFPDVHVLNSNGITIHLFQISNDIFQCGRTKTENLTSLKGGTQIAIIQPEILKFKCRGVFSSLSYGVGLC